LATKQDKNAVCNPDTALKYMVEAFGSPRHDSEKNAELREAELGRGKEDHGQELEEVHRAPELGDRMGKPNQRVLQ